MGWNNRILWQSHSENRNSWRDLPAGPWNTTINIFWADKTWGLEHILHVLSIKADRDALIIDAAFIKVAQHATGAKDALPIGNRTNKGRTDKQDSYCCCWRFQKSFTYFPHSGQCQRYGTHRRIACKPVRGQVPCSLLLWHSNPMLEQAKHQNMEVVIPFRKYRRHQREHDPHMYKERHLVEYFSYKTQVLSRNCNPM